MYHDVLQIKVVEPVAKTDWKAEYRRLRDEFLIEPRTSRTKYTPQDLNRVLKIAFLVSEYHLSSTTASALCRMLAGPDFNLRIGKDWPSLRTRIDTLYTKAVACGIEAEVREFELQVPEIKHGDHSVSAVVAVCFACRRDRSRRYVGEPLPASGSHSACRFRPCL